MQTWYEAWAQAATGPHGFWRDGPVVDHFRTASATTPLLARMVRRLLTDRPEIGAVLEIGAGDGRLLRALHTLDPGLDLVGIDLRRPPEPLPGVTWITGEYDVLADRWRGPAAEALSRLRRPTLVICAEWLDDLPGPVVGACGGRWHEVLVGTDGREQLGDPPAAPDRAWLDRWWPTGTESADRNGVDQVRVDQVRVAEVRAEVGRTRDRAWQGVIAALRTSGGAALMIDYGHLRTARPPQGSLTGFVHGREVAPEPSPAVNLTADVAVDAVAAAGEEAGARTDFLVEQRSAVSRLLPPDPTPGPPAARPDGQPAGPGTLALLQERSERHALASAFGNHWWLLQTVERSADLAP